MYPLTFSQNLNLHVLGFLYFVPLLVCFSSSILSLLYTCCLPQARKTNSKSKTFGIVLMFFLSYDNPDTMFGLHLHTLPPRSSDDCFKDARNTFASKARSQNYSVSISLAVFHASFSWPYSTKQHILSKFKVCWQSRYQWYKCQQNESLTLCKLNLKMLHPKL